MSLGEASPLPEFLIPSHHAIMGYSGAPIASHALSPASAEIMLQGVVFAGLRIHLLVETQFQIKRNIDYLLKRKGSAFRAKAVPLVELKAVMLGYLRSYGVIFAVGVELII